MLVAEPARIEWRADAPHAPSRPRLAIARPTPPRPKQLALWADEPPPPCRPRKPRREGADYLPNDELEAAILRGDRDGACSLLLKLAAKVVGMKAAAIPPTLDHDDLVQLAVIDCLRRLDTWEPGRASAFSFATGSVKFTILAECKRERRWLEVNRQLDPDEDGPGLDGFAGIDRGTDEPLSVEPEPCGPFSAISPPR